MRSRLPSVGWLRNGQRHGALADAAVIGTGLAYALLPSAPSWQRKLLHQAASIEGP
jgi:hypothetical protein